MFTNKINCSGFINGYIRGTTSPVLILMTANINTLLNLTLWCEYAENTDISHSLNMILSILKATIPIRNTYSHITHVFLFKLQR